MKIIATSDLHGGKTSFNDIEKFAKKANKYDLLIIAGDIACPPHNFQKTLSYFTVKTVVVPGNHDCFHKKTEVLTKRGWKYICDINKDDKVGQFDINTGKISFSYPLAFINKFESKLLDINSAKTRQVVSFNHEVVYNNSKVKAKELLSHKLCQDSFRLSGTYKTRGISLSDDEIRFLTWIIMDGCLVNRGEKIHHIQFKLSKERKIKSLVELLDRMQVKYTLKLCKKGEFNILQPFYIRIYGEYARCFNELLKGKKYIPVNWKEMSKKQLEIFLEVLKQTDGHQTYNEISWATIDFCNVDVIFELCIKQGYICIFKSLPKSKGFKNGKLQYEVRIFKELGYAFKKVSINEIEYNDYVYCVTMPLGTLITRFEGRIAFTGNCWTSDPEPHASLIIYNVILPHICEKLNVHYLDKKPLIISDKLAIVGTMGWYDYSFKDKSVPATGLDYSNKSFCGSVFCDKYYVKWHYDDKQFVKYQLKLMKKHLELVKDIETVIFVSHFVPYKEALDCFDYYQKLKAKSDKKNAYAADIKRTQQMFWRFGNAFQGSGKIGKLLDQYDNVKYIICGHQHRGKHIIHNNKDIYVIDTDYGKIRYNTLTL